MLQSLLWDDEVREADFPSLDEAVRVSAKEAEMASSLVENMSADFAPEKFSDDYQAQLRELIAAKLEQGDALDTAATFGEEDAGEPGGGQVVDLMDALRRSVEENRSRRSGSTTTTSSSAGEQASAGKKAPAKKSSARRTPAKRAATKKAGTKKSSTTKSSTKKAGTKKASAEKTAAKKSA